MVVEISGFDVLARETTSLCQGLAQPVGYLGQGEQGEREIKVKVEPLFLSGLTMSKV
jgi:hypothetical protein